MTKKFLEFIKEAINNEEIIINVKKHMSKGSTPKYVDDDWDIEPFHEFDDINNYLRGKNVFFVVSKTGEDDDFNQGEVAIFDRLDTHKNQIIIHYYKIIRGVKRHLSGNLMGDEIIYIKYKEMGDFKFRDKVSYHLGTKNYNWLKCNVIAFDPQKNKIFIVNWMGDHTSPFTFWVDPEELIKNKGKIKY